MDTINTPLTVEEAAREFAPTPRFGQGTTLYTHCMESFEAGAAWQKDQGHIKWYSVNEATKPPLNNNGQSDDLLLLNREHKLLSKGKYYQSEASIFSPSNGAWIPTHWAYINLPE